MAFVTNKYRRNSILKSDPGPAALLYHKKEYKTGRVIKLSPIPNPTSATVSEGANPASRARAPAETMGGMPASKIDT